jgi:hypothetical protein
VVKSGRREIAGGIRQMFRCSSCMRRFSTLNRTGKRTEARAVLKALILRCNGYCYDEIAIVLKRKYGVIRTPSAICRWVREFAPPYLQTAQRTNPVQGPTVRSWFFTHNRLNYTYQIHLGKLALAAPFNNLKPYLLQVPATLDHSLFERTRHCSQMRFVQNRGLKHSQFTGLNMVVLKAVTLSESRRARHQTVEDYLLNCDCATIATEVPVYYDDRHLGLIAGHIDVLQVSDGLVQIMDYKPDAAHENPEKVITQLNLYAIALAVRAGLHLTRIRCTYFDEEDAYSFNPRKPDRERILAFAATI